MIVQKLLSYNKNNFFQSLDFAPLVLAVVCGLVASVVTVQSPLVGIALVLGVFGFVIVSTRAEIPFSLLVLSFAIPVQKTIGGLPLNATDGIIVAWGLAWPLLMMRRSLSSSRFSLFPAWAALPLIISATLSLFVAINFGGSLKQVIRLVEWLLILPILMLSLKSEKNFWNWITLLFISIPVFFAMDGVVEVLNHGNSLTKMLGIPVPIPSAEFSKIRHTFDVSGRAGSTFGGAQGLAMYLTMMMSVIISIVLFPPKPAFRKFATAALVACLVGIYFTKSRGGFLGVVVMSTIILLTVNPRLGVTVIIVGVILFLTTFLSFLLLSGWDGTIVSLIPGRPEAVLDRLIIWSRALHVFFDHIFLGVGFGGFRDAVYQQGGIRLNVELGYESLHSHNTYLEVLTGTGILGFVCYIGFLAVCMIKLISLWRTRASLPSDSFILAAIGALSAYMMFGMVDMLFLQNMHFILISILTLGFLAGHMRREDSKS